MMRFIDAPPPKLKVNITSMAGPTVECQVLH